MQKKKGGANRENAERVSRRDDRGKVRGSQLAKQRSRGGIKRDVDDREGILWATVKSQQSTFYRAMRIIINKARRAS